MTVNKSSRQKKTTESNFRHRTGKDGYANSSLKYIASCNFATVNLVLNFTAYIFWPKNVMHATNIRQNILCKNSAIPSSYKCQQYPVS